jgi:hypothetical protein
VFGTAGPPDEILDLRGKTFASTLGVWRIRSGERTSVLKLLALGAGPTRAWRSEAEVESPFYWRREVEVYASDLLDGAPFRAPRHQAFERRDGSVALWLEDVGDPEPWPSDDIAAVTARLASMRAPETEPPWLARGWLRRYLEVRADRVDPSMAVWQRREEILERIEAGPIVLVHNDFHPGNVFRPGDQTVVIDWAFCGLGAPGDDAGILAADFLFDGFVPLDDPGVLADHIDHIWEAYSSALEPSLRAEAEFAYFAGNALRYAWASAVSERFALVYAALASAAATRLPSFA